MSDVVHVPESTRFEVVQGEERAVLTYTLREDSVVLEHTIVPSELEGHGVGTHLAAAALEWARSEGLAVVPHCSFVRAHLEHHPEAAEGLDVR